MCVRRIFVKAANYIQYAGPSPEESINNRLMKINENTIEQTLLFMRNTQLTRKLLVVVLSLYSEEKKCFNMCM